MSTAEFDFDEGMVGGADYSGVYRLRTRIAHVQSSEARLEEKRQHCELRSLDFGTRSLMSLTVFCSSAPC